MNYTLACHRETWIWTNMRSVVDRVWVAKSVISRLRSWFQETENTRCRPGQDLPHTITDSVTDMLTNPRDRTGSSKIVLQTRGVKTVQNTLHQGFSRHVTKSLFSFKLKTLCGSKKLNCWASRLESSVVYCRVSILLEYDIRYFLAWHEKSIQNNSAFDRERRVIDEEGLWYELESALPAHQSEWHILSQ